MFKTLRFIRILPLIVIVFFVARMLGQNDLQDILRFIISILLYGAGILTILWALTSGRKKPPDSKNTKKKTDK